MTSLLVLAALATAPSAAQDADDNRVRLPGSEAEARQSWNHAWYWDPISAIHAFRFSPGRAEEFCGRVAKCGVQIVAGVEGGIKYRYASTPNWFGYTRGQATTKFSVIGQDLGVDLRLGSFFGADHDYVRVTTGPDFFVNFYGIGGLSPNFPETPREYIVNLAPGIAWDTRAYVKLTKDFWIGASVTPAFPFAKPSVRKDEVAWTVTANYFGTFNFTIGYSQTHYENGVLQAIILSSDLF